MNKISYPSLNPSLIANYLLIAYAFFLPISHKASSILIISIAIMVLFSGDLKTRFLHAVNDKIVIALVIFFGLHLLWMIGSDHLRPAYLKVKDFIYILHIIPIAMVIKREYIPRMLAAFMAAMFFSEIVSYAMRFGITIPLIPVNTNGTNVPFMEWYTQYSAVLSITLGIILYQLLTKKDLYIWVRILYIIFFISASFNIFIVASRIGYMLYTLSILSALMMVYKKQAFKVTAVGLVLIIAGYTAAYMTSDLFRHRVSVAKNDLMLIEKGDLATSIGARAGYYLYSYPIILQHPIFGVGTADHIAEVCNEIRMKEKNPQNREGLLYNLSSGHNASLHSEYLDTLVQFGLIGLLLFANIFYQIYRYRQDNDLLKMIQILTANVLLFVSLGSVIFIHAELGRIFILLIALTLHYKEDESNEIQSPTKSLL